MDSEWLGKVIFGFLLFWAVVIVLAMAAVATGIILGWQAYNKPAVEVIESE